MFALPSLISPPTVTAEAVIPNSQDIRDAAVSAMTEGISQLGHDLAALAPVDSASVSNDDPDVDTQVDMPRTSYAGSRPAQSIASSRPRLVNSESVRYRQPASSRGV